jgi:arsenate reductase
LRILFLCVANSARSQIAEGLARTIWGSKAEVRSAGSAPSGTVNPLALQVLEEIGIDISTHYSKSIEDVGTEFLDKLDYVITLCAEESCPVVLMKKKVLNWGLPDPVYATDPLTAFRHTRDQIKIQIESFKQQL